MLTVFRRSFKIIVDYLFIFVCVLPFAYSVGGVYGVITVTFVCMVTSMHTLLDDKHAASIMLGIFSGLIISIILWIIFGIKIKYWKVLDVTFLIAFCVSFVLGMLPYSFGLVLKKHPFFSSKKLKHWILLIGLSALVLSLLAILLKVSGDESVALETAIVRGALYGICVGALYSVFLRDVLIPVLGTFSILVDYLYAMVLPVSAFFMGYLIIILTFGGFFGVMALHDPYAFTGATVPWRFNEFLYYSFLAITTVGDADIFAHSILAKWFTVFEVVLGVVWMTVVFAATLGYLQKTFSKLTDKYCS